MSLTEPPYETPADRLATFFDVSQPCDAFDDLKIEEVALLLQRLEHFAQKSPRTYIVLRSIGRLEVLERILEEGFHDACFPVELRGLPDFLDPRIKASIVQNQRLILTKSNSTLLEKGRHCHFAPDDPLPFVILSVIGSGSYGLVHKIESRVTFKQYALKTVNRRAAFGNPTKAVMKAILNEIQVMKGLSHKHVVDYVGSYTDKRSFGIVMEPIADQDLASYMEQTSATTDNRPTLRTFFGCLATALAFLHENHIRHRDIKPQNILVLRSNVLFTDFGLARESMDTSSGPMLVTSRYCASEVIAAEKRNEAADMWSLGSVFLEIMAALQGHNVDWLKGYYATIDSGSTHFHTNSAATLKLLADWSVHCTEADAAPLRWIKSMLTIHRLDRPPAEQIATQATNLSMYCCDQCHDADDADSIGSIVADFLDDLEHGRESFAQDDGKGLAIIAKSRSSPDLSLFHPEPQAVTSLVTVADANRGQVFGASLEICNRFAGVDTFFYSSTSRTIKTRARIPVVVVQCCNMLCTFKCSSRQSYLDLLAETHALSLTDHERITQLKRIFAESSQFIDDREWKILPKARVYALQILHDYLHSLPEPLADRFVSASITSFHIHAFAEAYHHMFPPNRHLLIHLLNTFGHLVTEAGDDTTGDQSGSLLALGQTLQAIASRFHGVIFDIKDEHRQVLAEKLLSNLIMDTRKDKILHKWESQRVGVFGIHLEDMLEYASEDVGDRTFLLSGEDYSVPGRVPILVTRCCEFILRCSRKDGRFYNSFQNVHNVSEDLITRMRDAFDRAPTFGKHVQWGRCGVEEAAAVLSEFLQRLPEPLIAPWYLDDGRVISSSRLWTTVSSLIRNGGYNVATDNFSGRSEHESALDSWMAGLFQLSEERRSILLYLLAFWASYIEIALAEDAGSKLQDVIHDLSSSFGPILLPDKPKHLHSMKRVLKVLMANATYFLDSASGGHKKARRRQIEDAKMKQDAADRASKAEAERVANESRLRAEVRRAKREAEAQVERKQAEQEERALRERERVQARARWKKVEAKEKRKNGFRARLGRTVDHLVVNAYVRLHGPQTPDQASPPALEQGYPQPHLLPMQTSGNDRPQAHALLHQLYPEQDDQPQESQSLGPSPHITAIRRREIRRPGYPRPPSVHTLDSVASYDEIIRTLDVPDPSRA